MFFRCPRVTSNPFVSAFPYESFATEIPKSEGTLVRVTKILERHSLNTSTAP